MMSSFLYIVAILLLVFLLSISLYFNIKLGIVVLNIEDSIEECLDIIDERYASISKVLEIPIFFDSVEVRSVVSDIDSTRHALLVVANKLSQIDKNKKDQS